MDTVAEQRAIDICLSGEKEAFRPLVDAYFGRLVRLAAVMIGDFDEARDLTQEAFIAAYQALPKFQRGRPFYPWLRGILMNRCRAHLRARLRAAARRQRAAEQPDAWVTGAAYPAADSRRVAQVVRQALARLGPEDREILVLKHMEGYSYDELAAALGIGAGTVASRLYRARQRMRQALAELDPTLVEEDVDPAPPREEGE